MLELAWESIQDFLLKFRKSLTFSCVRTLKLSDIVLKKKNTFLLYVCMYEMYVFICNIYI